MDQLVKVVRFLIEEARRGEDGQCERRHHDILDILEYIDTPDLLELLRQSLCVRVPVKPLPEWAENEIEGILLQRRSSRLLTVTESLPLTATFPRSSNSSHGNIILWRGDITTLSGGITAITNAANSQGLGCFQSNHRCIDNVIHSWAGPKLRDECFEIMSGRGSLATGEAMVTKGYCLPAEHVVHVVGPQLARGAEPGKLETEQLAACYRSVLQAVERLAPRPDGRKTVALCGISTGLFAFPVQQAAGISVGAVHDWLAEHPETTITDIIFNTFTEAEHDEYSRIFASPPGPWISQEPQQLASPKFECESLEKARRWLQEADGILVSAGAGLSASDGLDYNSQALFSEYFPGVRKKYGLRTLYSVFGFSKWPTEKDRWGYFFTHLSMVKEWPGSAMYQTLISWLERFGDGAHVRTSNADGLFLANGWSADRISTPQGSYSILQCLANCRPDAWVPSEPLRIAAKPFVDASTQKLSDPTAVPVCEHCGGKMNICVRAASWFNERPFQEGERRWKEFRAWMRQGKKVVILELGVGMSTPGVLRVPNEKLLEAGEGNIKLVRVCMGAEGVVPADLVEAGRAVSVDGDIATVVQGLCR